MAISVFGGRTPYLVLSSDLEFRFINQPDNLCLDSIIGRPLTHEMLRFFGAENKLTLFLFSAKPGEESFHSMNI